MKFLKLQKMEFGQKIIREIDLFNFMSFLAWTFLNFLARYASGHQQWYFSILASDR